MKGKETKSEGMSAPNGIERNFYKVT